MADVIETKDKIVSLEILKEYNESVRNKLIETSTTQPASSNNKIWFQPQSGEVILIEKAEFDSLEARVKALEDMAWGGVNPTEIIKSMLDIEIDKLRKELQEEIQNAFGSVANSLSELLDISEESDGEII